MQTEEQAIRDMVATWISATKSGDTETVLGLMADDVVFLLLGPPPTMSKADFAAQSAQRLFEFECVSDIQEIKVLGDWAYLWSKLTVVIVLKEGAAPIKRQGNALSILKKENGKWVLFRDANMLTVVPE